jgi:hypothetical protein
MIEFGSDFHSCENAFVSDSNYFERIERLNHYASGRQAIEDIINQEKWKRIWIPVYFCYEVIDYISSLGIEVKFYDDNPLKIDDDDYTIKCLPYKEGDVLLRVNYYGLRNKRSNKKLTIPVIEDHTHSIVSDWAIKSDADWCVASLRKSLPIACGGLLWSPQKRNIPDQINTSEECEKMAGIRYEAMRKKAFYLNNGGDKNEFREKFILSEEMIEGLSLTNMDTKSLNITETMNIMQWFDNRRYNWEILCTKLSDKFNIIKPSHNEEFYPFSTIILCDSHKEREILRQYLISNSIYPAILWNVPQDTNYPDALDFSKRMLSIHCDARYSTEDIKEMCKIINAFL